MLNDPSFLERASPIVDKFYILTREDDSISATQLKPNQQEQTLLNMLTDMPVFQTLSQEEKGLIWRFRHSQSARKEALPKFLLSVNWERPSEREQAISLLQNWAEIDLEQALPLLSGFFCLNDMNSRIRLVDTMNDEVLRRFKEIRNHAVKVLEKVPEARVQLVLLQLV